MRVRDAVVGDIVLNEWEEFCVRSPAFQRLHRIKQLGNAFHAYPSAMHTRFEHSLGVCHQVKRLFSHPRFFPANSRPTSEETRLVQLAALLHDVVHTPFRHTLDRDAAVLPAGDPEGEYAYRIEQMGLGDRLSRSNVAELLRILSIGNAQDLARPYFRQVVEDTIAADLLDYSRRDAYFTTGAMRQWDERIYDHIAVANYENKPCIVARITDDLGLVAESAITELTNLLQIRYVLTERVYLYPIKVAADALLVKSIRCLLGAWNRTPEDFKTASKEMSDDELVNYLVSSEVPEASWYALCLKNRQLPKLAFSFRADDDPSEQQREAIQKHCRGHMSLDRWLKCEEDIAKSACLHPCNVIVYCHDPKMQRKLPDFLIEDEQPEPRVLSAHPRMLLETKAIAEKHASLWRCYVFCLERDQESLARVKAAAKEVLRSLR
jgi:HD superfamily phosphohydrolase